MACPTCDHTMQGIGEINKGDCRVFWCPRCGTLRYKHSDGQESDSTPKLPARVVELLLACDNETVKIARRVGVIESSMPPSERTGAFK